MHRRLSKSKLISYRQCPKRLWLEIHRPELAEVSAASEAVFRTGHQVGAIAQQLYDPEQRGSLIDLKAEGVEGALQRTATLLGERRPIFEAGLRCEGAMAFSDILLPAGTNAWRMVEVKASGSVKEYQRDDVAIQSFIAREAGLTLTSTCVAHVDTTWVYPGDGDYRGLLKEVDLTREVIERSGEVRSWIDGAQAVVAGEEPPDMAVGRHCQKPFACGFVGHCGEGAPTAKHPVQWLPRVTKKALKALIEDEGFVEMADIPQELLSPLQRRVRECTLMGTVYFDAAGAKDDLAGRPLPALFLDFESIGPAVPLWAGTRPFQQIPFQFSLHRVEASGEVSHHEFLDLTGRDPSRPFAEALIACGGQEEPVFVYNAAFEGGRLEDLAARHPDRADGLRAIRGRLVDLWPIAVRRYYHPRQEGSWSIKKLLPAMVPALHYDNLNGVADGDAAQRAYLEAIDPAAADERRAALGRQLLAYCGLDTWGMVEVWNVLSGAGMSLQQLANGRLTEAHG